MATLVGDSGLFMMSEFKGRGIIKLAPDIVVYIAGSFGTRVLVPAAGVNQKVSFNDGITAVSVQNVIDPPGSSSATIEIVTPIYGEYSNYWTTFNVDGKTIRMPIFVPMLEVRIYAKGRFLVNFEPKYYPVFWGFITNVEESYSGGVWRVTLTCADMLHWWEYCQLNVHPIPETNYAIGGGQIMTAYSTIFKDANPFTIIWRLARDIYESKVIADETARDDPSAMLHRLVVPTWLAQKNSLSQIYPPDIMRLVAARLMKYWQKRFGNLGTMLKMYGASGKTRLIRDKYNRIVVVLDEIKVAGNDPAISLVKQASCSRLDRRFDVDNCLNNFTVFFEFENMSDFADAEYMSKLEIATEVKNRVEYEFFQDVDGAFVFKPPFFNLNTKYVEPYVIRPYDIISSSFQTDADAIVTVLEIKCPFHGQMRSTEYPNTVGFHIDVNLAEKYGIKFKSMNLQYIRSDAKVANQLALGHLGMINAKAFTGTLVIPGRPEIRLGYPIYIDHQDSFHYIRSINHSFDFGGSFTTTLSLEAERKRLYADEDTVYTEPLKNRVYLFTGNLEALTVVNPETKKKEVTYLPVTPEEKNALSNSGMNLNDLKIAELLRYNQRLWTNAQGRYKIVTIEEADRIVTGKLNARPNYDYGSVTDWTVPLTDEEGYQVIGSFRYGRGIHVTGETRLLPSELNVVARSQSESEALATVRCNHAVTNMAPGSYYESLSMKTFFDGVNKISAANKIPHEGIIPNFINFDEIALLDENWEYADNGISTATEQIANMSPPQPRKESPKLVKRVKKPKG